MKSQLQKWIVNRLPARKDDERAAQGTAKIHYSGNYSSWQDARDHSLGYDMPELLERLKDAAFKIKSGQALYERDSVLFDQPENHFALVSALLMCALAIRGDLNVIDIGGSIGSTFTSCRPFLNNAQLHWSVVEHAELARFGRNNLQTDALDFFEDLESCLASRKYDVALLSGVLAYVESPYALLDDIARTDINHIIIDRTHVWNSADRLTIQCTPPAVYGFNASYPAWILNQDKLLSHLRAKGYRLIFDFEALDGKTVVDGIESRYVGSYLARENTSAG